MNTRIALKSDIKAIREMWNDYYGLSPNFCDWFFNRAFYSQNSIVAVENDTITASSGFIPYQIKLGDAVADAAYIAGMVTLPEYRTEENTKQLLADTLLAANAKGMPICFLIPHRYDFYEKHGFRTCYSFKQYTITPDMIPAFVVRHKIQRHKINDKVVEALDGVYKQYMEDKNGYILRTDETWRLILEDLIANFGGKIAVAYDGNSQAQGYILYVARDGVMGVYEMAYTSRGAYESLMGYIKGHELNTRKITIKADTENLSYLDFCDNKNPISVYPFVTARITNAQSALEYCLGRYKGNIKLKVIDRLIEDNNRTFNIADGKVTVCDEQYDAAVDIGTLTMLLFGYISINDAKRLGLITGNTSSADGLFRKENNFINMLYF